MRPNMLDYEVTAVFDLVGIGQFYMSLASETNDNETSFIFWLS